MKPTLLVLFISATSYGFGQIQERFFYLDITWQATRHESDAVAFLRVRQMSDSDFEWTYYNLYGPMIKQENFKDISGKILNGKCTYYRANGTVDSSGPYVNNLQNGTWSYEDDSCRVTRKKEFDMGHLVKDTLLPKPRDDKKGENPGEIESEYPGGVKAWTNYLDKNMRYTQRAQYREISGEVIAEFTIDQEGKVVGVGLTKSVEYSLDEEVVRLIMNSGMWQPAFKDGARVKSYKRQSVRFGFAGVR